MGVAVEKIYAVANATYQTTQRRGAPPLSFVLSDLLASGDGGAARVKKLNALGLRRRAEIISLPNRFSHSPEFLIALE